MNHYTDSLKIARQHLALAIDYGQMHSDTRDEVSDVVALLDELAGAPERAKEPPRKAQSMALLENPLMDTAAKLAAVVPLKPPVIDAWYMVEHVGGPVSAVQTLTAQCKALNPNAGKASFVMVDGHLFTEKMSNVVGECDPPIAHRTVGHRLREWWATIRLMS